MMKNPHNLPVEAGTIVRRDWNAMNLPEDQLLRGRVLRTSTPYQGAAAMALVAWADPQDAEWHKVDDPDDQITVVEA